MPNGPPEKGKVYKATIEDLVYKATIEDLGREGDGIARIDNFVVFVPGTKIGDTVKVRITRVLRRMAIGEVVEE